MNKKIVTVLAIGSIMTSASMAYSASTLMQIGRSPFHRPPLASTQDLASMAQTQTADMREGFEKAGCPELFDPFMKQIAAGNIESKDYPKGSQFEWMFFKRKGTGEVRLSRELTWGNEVPFPAYVVKVVQDSTLYTFAVPLGCGNVALAGEEPFEEPVAEVVVEKQPPVCRAMVSPVKAFSGSSVAVDASGSTDPDGKVTSMKMVTLDENGQPLSEQVVAGGLVGSIVLPAGAKSVQTTVTDDDGLTATSPECMAPVTVVKRTNFIADVGAYHMFDPGNWVFGRVGLEYRFDENWSVLGLAGYAQHVQGSDGASAVLVDVLGQYRVDRLFFNLGVGGWLSTNDDGDGDYDDTDADLIAGMGYRIYGEPDAFNASLFVEARSAFDELGSPVDSGRVGGGVRFNF
ncbi:MAG: hypothetical protein M0O96_02565 [Desulforhopalus sp.]|nr:hypothetical protein [Desulforhopalus sp.]